MKAIALLIMMTFVYGLMYLLGAFVCWEANPGGWPQEARAFFAIVGTVLVAFLSIGALA